MKLAISNIAWEEKNDFLVYELMRKYQFTGLEIAPTRIFLERPYHNLDRAVKWKEGIEQVYGLEVPSIQSIWFGKQERVFGSEKEREVLLKYTKSAMDFAAAIKCRNLVFGCPRNRYIPEGTDEGLAIEFFSELGSYALRKGVVIGLEANPPIYNTNYINDTASALKLVQEVKSEGFKLNLDVGTMIENQEQIEEIQGQVALVSHVHISEPKLKEIEKRNLHMELAKCLKREKYNGFISIEMGKTQDISVIEDAMAYVKETFQ